MTAATAPAAPTTQIWPCLPGCVDTTGHADRRVCAVPVGGTLSGLSVQARRDCDTGESWLEFTGEPGPVSQLDALALAGALRDGVTGLRGGGLPR